MDPGPCFVYVRIVECLANKNSFSCHVDFIVNQICRFTSTMKKKPSRNLTVACHWHPTEWNWWLHREGFRHGWISDWTKNPKLTQIVRWERMRLLIDSWDHRSEKFPMTVKWAEIWTEASPLTSWKKPVLYLVTQLDYLPHSSNESTVSKTWSCYVITSVWFWQKKRKTVS